MRRTFSPAALAVILCAALFAATAQGATTSRGSGTDATKGAQVFRVAITFTQTRPWTYYHQQVSTSSPVCTRTEQRNGADTVHITGSTLFTYQPGVKSTAGFGITGAHGRTGVGTSTGTFASLISDIATQVEHILGSEFKARGFDPKFAPMYSQMLVGMVALTGQWWLDARRPKKAEVAAHLVNLSWNGLSGLEPRPELLGRHHR